MSVSAEWQTLRSNCNNRSISRKEEKRYLDLKKNRVKGEVLCWFCFVFREERLGCILRISKKSEQDSRNKRERERTLKAWT